MKAPYFKCYSAKSMLLFFLLLLNISLSNGQQVKNILIDTDKLEKKPLLLSEITENVTSITLESPIDGGVVDVFLTNQYLFVTTMSSVYQFKPSGKFVSKFNCGGTVYHSTCDTTKQEMYILMGSKIKSFDFSGKLKKEYPIKNVGINCFFHEGKLWIQSATEFVSLKTTPVIDYKLSYLNLKTGVETFLPLKVQEKIKKDAATVSIYAETFSVDNQANNRLVCSFTVDGVLCQIQGQKVSPIVRWNIRPVQDSKINTYYKGILKDYLFVNFRFKDNSLLYVQNMKTQKQYLTEFLRDDIFDSGEFKINPLNQGGYFYFFKKENNLKGKYSKNDKSKNRDVIIIANVKENK